MSYLGSFTFPSSSSDRKFLTQQHRTPRIDDRMKDVGVGMGVGVVVGVSVGVGVGVSVSVSVGVGVVVVVGLVWVRV